MVTQERLKELLHYDPSSGKFTRITTRRGCAAGGSAGSVTPRGYVQIMIDWKKYYVHRLAWLYMCGEWPNQIDHINHDRGDNRFCNLRNVALEDNQKNLSRNTRNKSGVTGVYWAKRNRKWVAQISSNNKTFYLGEFADINAAILTRMVANHAYNFHENHGSKKGAS